MFADLQRPPPPSPPPLPPPPPPPLPPPPPVFVSPRSYAIDGFICCFSFPFVPNPQSHSPFPLTKHHIAKTKRALAPFPQTIPLCLSSVEEHVECWIFAYNTTSFADVVKTLVCTMFFASGVYEFMLLWTSCMQRPSLSAHGLFRPCELLIESCIFLWFQGFGLYTDRRDVHIKDSRKDGRHTASWTRRIPGSLILTSIIVYFTFQ